MAACLFFGLSFGACYAYFETITGLTSLIAADVKQKIKPKKYEAPAVAESPRQTNR
jgi:hypothetical protein